MVKVMEYDEKRLDRALENVSAPRTGNTDAFIERARVYRTFYGDNTLAADVLRDKYLAPADEGSVLRFWDRIARAISSVEDPSQQDKWYQAFMDSLFDFRFVPGGRIMHGAGRIDAKRQPTLSNCYVIPITEDSLEGIYLNLREAAMVYRSGGGVGTDLSVLRPRGSLVNATIDKSPGCTAFMNLLSESTNAVSQAGRRGALMLTLRADHPDVEDFVTIKNDSTRTKVQYANISVLITDELMRAVESDSNFDLKWGDRVYRTVRARELWNKIITNAHSSAEPGIIFWDTMRAYHNVEYANPLSSTNPCGEQALAAYTACNLGNLNMMKFVRADGSIDLDGIVRAARVTTRFLDDVIDYNMENHALPKIREAVASDRRVGLGVTGLADALVLMRLKYDSEEALKVVDEIMKAISLASYEASIELAEEKGKFPIFDSEGISRSKFIQGLPEELQGDIQKKGLRNSTLITMPPVGSGSIIAQTTSGIEPIFCTSYMRRVKQADGESFKEYKVYHPLVKELFGGDGNLPSYVVTAHQIDPFFRVKMQGVIQRFVDSSISSTINLPEDIPVETIGEIYINAWKMGLKGVTVYREGSREGILQTEGHTNKKDGTLEQRVASNGYIHPMERPAVLEGVTIRTKTGEGNLYNVLNYHQGKLFEVFSSLGKAGGNAAAQSEAISRLISLALRSNIDPREVVEELMGISGPMPVWDGGEQILSTPDAIAKAMKSDLIRRGMYTLSEENQTLVASSDEGKKKKMLGNGTCPECGSPTQEEGACMICAHCGWSKC
ncbi:adenosylcobalamin-dependent ribonucleoside-diphosphate reductase [Candidatus Woesearchaeota archaeon]|nr:adenosylcobalamin-dependent ribonucleoside-diphosphate reductase [Candidatus Woesearchaeota archaeon]